MKLRNLLRLAPVAAGALLMTYSNYLINNDLHSAGFGWVARVLNALQLPAVVVGVLVSNNVHQPNSAATYSALFVFYALLIGATVWVVKTLVGRRSAGRPK